MKANADYSMSWCQDCKCWVPAKELHYFDGFRVCTWCMEGVQHPEGTNFVYDPHHEQTQCIYCDSYDTTEQVPNWKTFKCNTCGETFKIL